MPAATKKTTTAAKKAAPTVEADISAADALDAEATPEEVFASAAETLDIPEDLQFATEAPEADEKDVKEPTAFTIRGQVLHAYEPSRGGLLLLMSSFSRNATEFDMINGILGFFNRVLSSGSKEWLYRYIDSDEFDENVLMDVIRALAKRWDAEELLPENRKNRAERRAAEKSKSKR
ncbi:hypothetical protein BJF84_21305 [Rhodococcus sp. CUA-806]|jgi:hypothetical protein|nr:hypothetical protein BJF84_21305 [Rhodococcus sp. CUA-806]